MQISLEEKKIEAVRRMNIMGIFPDAVAQFKKYGLINISYPPFGALFWADGEELDRIRNFEREHNTMVYFVIRSYTSIGKMDSYFFVSDYKDEEWETDREDLKHNQALVYVYNHDDEICSEYGSIGFERTLAAGLVRTW